ncbi:MAG: Gfo/Idh/MocA family oxidoreductase [Sedimentisphaerales bacterium]|nr:Gfo/Idh/MocA family oxidoreductase [Sedimentisphaerales bacterium]
MADRKNERAKGPGVFLKRRTFLKAAAGAGMLPYFIQASVLGKEGNTAASDRIVMAGIGIGNMGSGDLRAFLGRNDVQYVAVCDVKKEVRDGSMNRVNEKYGNQDCKVYKDFREIMVRDDIDAVHCATPDHWHAIIVIETCRNGKDIYCQKPETKTLREGKLMIDAARRYGRVVSGGSQRVLEDYRGTVDACWNGDKGIIKSINVNVGPLPMDCNKKGESVPAGFDWDMWLGPAPWAPYHPHRCSGSYSIDGTSWRSFKDYSGGGMTDWGAHHFGGATFAIDVRELEPEEVIFHNENGRKYATCRYPNGKLLHHNFPGRGNLDVKGTNEKGSSKPVPGYAGTGGIYGDFIDCVKTRKRPFRDIEYAVHTATVCHLFLTAYELERSLKWDTASQRFINDDEANRLVDVARREPWVI